MSFTDSFSGDLRYWTNQELSNNYWPAITSGVAYGTLASGYISIYYSGCNWLPDHRSKIKVIANNSRVAPGVRHSGTGRNGTACMYAYFSDGGLHKWVNGVQTVIGVSPPSAAPNDTIELETTSGNNLITYKNGAVGIAADDTAAVGGYAGICFFHQFAGADDWVGTGELTTGISFDQFGQGTNSGASSSCTFAHTCSGSDRMLFVAFAGDTSADNITGVTYDSVPMAFVAKKAPGNRWSYLYMLHNPNAGTHDVIISSGSTKYLLAASGSYNGAKQVSVADKHEEYVSVAVASLNSPLTTIADNCWIVQFQLAYPGAAQAGIGSTLRGSEASLVFTSLFDSGGRITPAAARSMETLRTSTTTICHMMASFEPVPSAVPMVVNSVTPPTTPAPAGPGPGPSATWVMDVWTSEAMQVVGAGLVTVQFRSSNTAVHPDLSFIFTNSAPWSDLNVIGDVRGKARLGFANGDNLAGAQGLTFTMDLSSRVNWGNLQSLDGDLLPADLSGFTAAFTVGDTHTIAAGPGTYTITGTAAALRVAHRLVADPGTYAITGTAARLAYAHRLLADPGTYSVTGTNATLAVAHRIVCAPGTYALTGTAAVLTPVRRIVASPGTYTITGTAVTLTHNSAVITHSMPADPGTYAVTGTPATLRIARRLHADPGVYALTGGAAVLRVNHVMAAAPGTYAMTGTAASMAFTRRVNAEPGIYAISGTDVQFIRHLIMRTTAGVYTITGTDVNLYTSVAVRDTVETTFNIQTVVTMDCER